MSDQIQIEVDLNGFNDAPSTVKVERGMKVYFSNIMGGQSMHIRGFSSSYWTSSSNAVLSRGVPYLKSIKSNAAIGTDALSVYDPVRGRTSTVYIEVVSSLPSNNPYTISENIQTSFGGLTANEFKVSNIYSLGTYSETIIHLRSDDPEVRFRLFDEADNHHEDDFYGNWVSDFYMNSVYRKQFQVGYRAPTEGHSSKTVKIYIGNKTYNITLSTGEELVPVSHEVINFGHTSGEVSLLDIKGFFGGGSNLRDYFRKGRNVPDMPTNSGIPTSGDLRITDFRGAATALFIAAHPRTIEQQLVTTYGTKSTSVGWNIWSGEIDDWDLGYSKFIKDNAQFRYTMSVTYQSAYGTTNPLVDPVLDSSTGNPSAWSSNNKQVSVTVTGQRREEFSAIITVNMYARHRDFTSKVVSTSAQFRVRVVGT